MSTTSVSLDMEYCLDRFSQLSNSQDNCKSAERLREIRRKADFDFLEKFSNNILSKILAYAEKLNKKNKCLLRFDQKTYLR